MRIVQLTVESTLSGVYVSQVIKPMAELVREGYSVNLIVMPTLGMLIRGKFRVKWRGRRREIRKSFHTTLTFIPSPPTRVNLWKPVYMLRLWMMRYMAQGSDRVVLHCRGATATHYGLNIRTSYPRCLVIFDCRGVTPAEVLHRHGVEAPVDLPPQARKRYREVDAYMREGALQSDAIICVSSGMKDYICEEYSIDRNRISVIPCLVDEACYGDVLERRNVMRNKLGVSDRFVFLYCGGMESWQQPRDIVRLYAQLGIAEVEKHFLGITSNPELLAAICEEEGLSDKEYTLLELPADLVPSYLCAGDMGFLLRDESLVNRVASPVKFAEYLAAGVPVLMTSNIGDSSSTGLRKGVAGIAHSLEPSAENIRFLERFCTEVMRHRTRYVAKCRQVARDEFSLKLYSQMVSDVYARAARGVFEG